MRILGIDITVVLRGFDHIPIQHFDSRKKNSQPLHTPGHRRSAIARKFSRENRASRRSRLGLAWKSSGRLTACTPLPTSGGVPTSVHPRAGDEGAGRLSIPPAPRARFDWPEKQKIAAALFPRTPVRVEGPLTRCKIRGRAGALRVRRGRYIDCGRKKNTGLS